MYKYIFVIALIIGSTSCSLLKKNNKQKEIKVFLTEEQKQKFDYSFMEANKEKMQGNIKKAIYWYMQCINIDKSSAVSHYELANIYLSLKDINSALYFSRKAVELNSKNKWYLIQLAQVYQNKSMIDNSAEVYKKLIELEPKNKDYYFHLAYMYISVERKIDAIEILNEYERENGIFIPVTVEKIKLYLQDNNTKKAYKESNKIIKKFPNNPDTYRVLAEINYVEKDFKSVIKNCNKILELNPNDNSAYYNLADTYRILKNYKKSYEFVIKAFKNIQIEVDTKIKYLIQLTINKKVFSISDDQEKELINILLKSYPDNIKIKLIFADFLTRNKLYEQSKLVLEQVVKVHKKDLNVWNELILLYNRLGELEKMYTASTDAILYFPEATILYIYKSIPLLQEKKYKEVLSTLKLVEDFIVNENKFIKSQYYTYLGEAHYNLESIEKAFICFEKVLSINPNDIMVLNNYSYYLSIHNKNLEKAEKYSARCIQLESTNHTYLDTYAWVLFKRKKYKDAKYFIEKSINNGGGKSKVIVEHYGDILYFIGNKDKALSQWKRSLEMGNTSEKLKLKIKQKKYVE